MLYIFFIKFRLYKFKLLHGMIHLVHLQRQSTEYLFHSKKQCRKNMYLLYYKFIQIIVNRTQRGLTQRTRLDHSICFCRNWPHSQACKTSLHQGQRCNGASLAITCSNCCYKLRKYPHIYDRMNISD